MDLGSGFRDVGWGLHGGLPKLGVPFWGSIHKD